MIINPCDILKNIDYPQSLWNPEVQCRIHKGSPIIHIMSQMDLIPPFDNYFFKSYSNIVLPSNIVLEISFM